MATTLTLWRDEHALLRLDDLANAAGLHPALLEKFVDFGLIEPAAITAAGALFAGRSIERLRCIVRIRRDLNVNLAGVGAILEMKDRIEALQNELASLRRIGGRRVPYRW